MIVIIPRNLVEKYLIFGLTNACAYDTMQAQGESAHSNRVDCV